MLGLTPRMVGIGPKVVGLTPGMVALFKGFRHRTIRQPFISDLEKKLFGKNWTKHRGPLGLTPSPATGETKHPQHPHPSYPKYCQYNCCS